MTRAWLIDAVYDWAVALPVDADTRAAIAGATVEHWRGASAWAEA